MFEVMPPSRPQVSFWFSFDSIQNNNRLRQTLETTNPCFSLGKTGCPEQTLRNQHRALCSAGLPWVSTCSAGIPSRPPAQKMGVTGAKSFLPNSRVWGEKRVIGRTTNFSELKDVGGSDFPSPLLICHQSRNGSPQISLGSSELYVCLFELALCQAGTPLPQHLFLSELRAPGWPSTRAAPTASSWAPATRAWTTC